MKRLRPCDVPQLVETYPSSLRPSLMQLFDSPAPDSAAVGNILVPASTPMDTESEFPEFLLKDFVQLDNPLWRGHILLCRRAIKNLGFPSTKSQDQLKAMVLVMDGRTNLFMVLPTAFGKSILYQMIAALPTNVKIGPDLRGGNVIVITPFAVLLMDQAKKSGALGISTYNWQDRGSLGDVPSSTRLIFIQPESFISTEFTT